LSTPARAKRYAIVHLGGSLPARPAFPKDGTMGDVHTEPEAKAHTPVWRDPLSAGFRAHRHLLLLRLRWHERRVADESDRYSGITVSPASPPT
jgi:hypothetical protein